MDDMILTENETLRNRVADLEKKVQEHADEIVCLRSTLADLIRRVTTLEGGRTGSLQPINQPIVNNNILPSKFSSLKSSSVKKTSNHIASESLQPNSGPVRATTPTHSSPKRTSRGSSPGPIKKWSSSSDFQGSPVHNATSSSKDIIFNQDDGYLRMYLRGHPITMYVPTENLRDYQYNKPLPPPSNKLHLEWVYGYRGRDCRSNLYLLPTGEMVYFIAAVVVLYNVEEQMQRHYTGHTDDVKCLAVHPNKFIIASGQLTGVSVDRKESRKRVSVNPADLSPLSEEAERLAHIRIWDSVSLNTMHIIGVGDFERSVSCMAFSKMDGGSYLCAVDESSEHVVSLWEWQKGDRGQRITEMKSGCEPVLAIDFHPIDKTLFVTCGKGHVNFWRIEGTTITKKLGLFEKYDKPKYVVCLAFSDSGDILTGDSNGNIFIWGKEGNTITKVMKNAHEGGVFSLCVLKDGTLISGGGKDRRIVAYDGQTFSKLGKESELSELAGPVRTLTQGKGNMILAGTTKNCILQGTLEFTFNVIIQGHTEELWGAAVHPNHHQFLTCGGDKQIHLWSSMTHDTLWSKDISESAISACFHPEGNVVVMGTTIGRWIALDIHTREVVSVHTDGNERLSCMAYSPDARFLAVGSHDNCIYVYQVSDDGRKYNRINRCQGHSSYITHIDWSKDSQYLMSNSGDYEILYWNAAVCRQVNSPSNLKDLEWDTHTCTLGFNVCGVWPENADGTDVNSCAKSHNSKLVAAGDDFGQVKLFSYPCNVPKSLAHVYRAHSSHVTRVFFLFDDTRLITLGGNDNSVMQWVIMSY